MMPVKGGREVGEKEGGRRKEGGLGLWVNGRMDGCINGKMDGWMSRNGWEESQISVLVLTQSLGELLTLSAWLHFR
jgi:hypothetical protein